MIHGSKGPPLHEKDMDSNAPEDADEEAMAQEYEEFRAWLDSVSMPPPGLPASGLAVPDRAAPTPKPEELPRPIADTQEEPRGASGTLSKSKPVSA